MPPANRQRVYQRRHKQLGLCVNCSRPAVSLVLCKRHLIQQRERQRAVTGGKPWKPGSRGRKPLA